MEIKDIRVIKPRIGGGFGAKQEMLIEDIVAHLAIATRRPVRLELEPGRGVRTPAAPAIPQTHHLPNRGRPRRQCCMAQDMGIIGNTGPYGTHGYTVQIVSPACAA